MGDRHNTFYLPEGIKENIFKYRLKDFLKQKNKYHSGDAYERLSIALKDTPELYPEFENFVIQELRGGKNRRVFWCDFSIEALAIIGNVDKIKKSLRSEGLPCENFSNLLRDKDFEQGELVYLNIDEKLNDLPEKIVMAFLNFYDVSGQDEEGNTFYQTVYTYTWVEIYPEKRFLLIRQRPYLDHVITDLHESNKMFNFYHQKIFGIFRIPFLNMIENKEILYNIFRNLTNRAEASYHDVISEAQLSIEEKVKELSTIVGIRNIKRPVDLVNRVSRLLERVLILNDLSDYMAYDPDKLGVVERIGFSDQSGARVDALAQDDGIEIADIYFDTRETLEELKQLNRIWVKWFYNNGQNGIHIQKKIEVQNDKIIIQFLGGRHTPQEVQEYVLSLFREFKEREIS